LEPAQIASIVRDVTFFANKNEEPNPEQLNQNPKSDRIARTMLIQWSYMSSALSQETILTLIISLNLIIILTLIGSLTGDDSCSTQTLLEMYKEVPNHNPNTINIHLACAKRNPRMG